MQSLLRILFVVFFATILASPAMAAGLEVNNISVATSSTDGVKARDLAITKAERMAFGALTGKTDADIAKISDTSIARLVKGFSVQGEKLTSRNYRAFFTIRFQQAATNNFILSNGWQLAPQAAGGQAIVFDNAAATAANTLAPTNAAGQNPATAVATATAATATTPAATQNIVILPILDIGSRRVVWDDPNPWREVWQKSDHNVSGATVSLPLGDVEDIADVPDAGFLNNNGTVNVPHLLQRYNATKLYIVLAKNMGAALNTESGMAISLYRHDGQQLKFIRKILIHPRPGYLFDDAVPAALQMITTAEGGSASTTINSDVLDSQNTTPADTPVATAPVQAISGGTLNVMVPYQSLQQWVGIQRRLRNVPGIKAVMPIRVSASSAQVKLVTTTTNTDDLSRNLGLQQFILQKMNNGDLVLVEQ